MTPFGSESPKSISKNKSAVTRPSTSSGHSQQGSSDGGFSAPVSPSRSVNPTPGSRAPTPTPTPTDARTRPRTRTRTSKTPSMMSSAQTVTTTAAAESGSRFVSSSEAYRYQGMLRPGMAPNRFSILPTTRPTSLFVNATATINAEATAPLSGPAGSRTSSRAAEAELSGHSNEAYQAQMRSRSYSHWSARIAGEIPIAIDEDTTEANAPLPMRVPVPGLRSPHSPYGPASASNAVITAGFAPIRHSPLQPSRGHVDYTYGSASSSGTAPEPDVFRPPSLASYTLTEPAAQASAGAGPSSWRDTVIGSSSSTTTTAGWLPPIQYPPSYHSSAFDAAQWNSPPSAAVAASERSASSAIPFALPGASPTHTGSPASTSGTATSSSWAPIPSAPAELEENVRSRSASTFVNKVLSSTPTGGGGASGAAATTRRPSLTRSAAGLPSSSSSSSMLHSSFAGSRSSITSTAAPTSASAASASASRVPGPAASSYDALPFVARSPAARSTVSGLVASEPSPNFTTFAAGNPQGAAPASVLAQTEQQLQQPSSPYDVQAQSSVSAQITRSDASPVHERERHEPADAFQAPFQQGGLSGHSSPETGAEARDSSGAMASGPPGQGPQDYLFAGTNTTAYSRQFGPSSVSDPGPSSLVARSATLLPTVPVTISAAEPYTYPYVSPPAATVPSSSSASAAAAVAGTGSGGSGSGQSTRKRNHACWMCHKSFDRPSTLRKHLLVHTGEKAYVCTICGRRFGVASNLNRHTRRCIARPVNSNAFHRTSESAPGTSASAGTLRASVQDAMAREQTNPDVRRGEREREGREVPDDDSERPAAPETPGTPGRSTAPQTRGRRRVRSDSPAPLGAPSASASSPPEAGPSSQQTPFQLRPAFGGGSGSGGGGQGSGQVAVATASTSTAEAEGERRPKRRRRAPSPSRWVPASLRAFSLSPTRHRTSTPLPPVSPGFDRATGTWEERDSYATPDDENVDPVGDSSSSSADPSVAENAARRREERRRNFEYCPYHPCGWTGRLPGPAVVGSDLTNYTKPIGGGRGGPGSRHHYSGDNTGGGGLSFMFEFSVAAAG